MPGAKTAAELAEDLATQIVKGAASRAEATAGTMSANIGTPLTFNKATRTWSSPGGLDYGMGSIHGNRIKHILAHTVPNPAKVTHSVFVEDRSKLISLIDEAWRMKGAAVPGDPGAFIVPMGRVIGTAGEKNIRIIVKPGTNKIISAYPVQ